MDGGKESESGRKGNLRMVKFSREGKQETGTKKKKSWGSVKRNDGWM